MGSTASFSAQEYVGRSRRAFLGGDFSALPVRQTPGCVANDSRTRSPRFQSRPERTRLKSGTGDGDERESVEIGRSLGLNTTPRACVSVDAIEERARAAAFGGKRIKETVRAVSHAAPVSCVFRRVVGAREDFCF